MEKHNEMTVGRVVPLTHNTASPTMPKFMDPRTVRSVDPELTALLSWTSSAAAEPIYVPVNVKLLHPLAKQPEYAHDTDSCFDIFSIENQELMPGDVASIRTGIAIQAPENYEFRVEDKSGLARQGLTTRGGVIDAGYTGELTIILANESGAYYPVCKGDKIAQVRVQPRYRASFYPVEELEPRDRGDNGFGSTGLKARPQ